MKPSRAPFSMQEDQKLIDFVIKKDFFSQIKGYRIWKILADTHVPKRTYLSLWERFRRRILPGILTGQYQLQRHHRESFQQLTAQIDPHIVPNLQPEPRIQYPGPSNQRTPTRSRVLNLETPDVSRIQNVETEPLKHIICCKCRYKGAIRVGETTVLDWNCDTCSAPHKIYFAQKEIIAIQLIVQEINLPEEPIEEELLNEKRDEREVAIPGPSGLHNPPSEKPPGGDLVKQKAAKVDHVLEELLEGFLDEIQSIDEEKIRLQNEKKDRLEKDKSKKRKTCEFSSQTKRAEKIIVKIHKMTGEVEIIIDPSDDEEEDGRRNAEPAIRVTEDEIVIDPSHDEEEDGRRNAEPDIRVTEDENYLVYYIDGVTKLTIKRPKLSEDT